MIYSDYHMHSEFSSDSDAPMEQMIQKSIQLGLKEICFTDHMDFDYPQISPDDQSKDGDVSLDFMFDPDAYLKQLKQLQSDYEDQIKIRIGIELGLQSQIQQKVQNLMETYDFDFAIGSSHLLYGDDPYWPGFWSKLRNQYGNSEPDLPDSELDQAIVKIAIRDYFEEILANVDRFPWFQVYGHLDYIVRYAPGKDTHYRVRDYMDVLEAILRKLIANGKGIEINTSGLKSGLKTANPHTEILKLYHDLGGEILTIGSDAHKPEHIAYQFRRAEEILIECGFHYYTTFSKKSPTFHTIC